MSANSSGLIIGKGLHGIPTPAGVSSGKAPVISIPKLKSQTRRNSLSSNIKSNMGNESTIFELISIINASLLPINEEEGNRALLLLNSLLLSNSKSSSDCNIGNTCNEMDTSNRNNQCKENVSNQQQPAQPFSYFSRSIDNIGNSAELSQLSAFSNIASTINSDIISDIPSSTPFRNTSKREASSVRITRAEDRSQMPIQACTPLPTPRRAEFATIPSTAEPLTGLLTVTPTRHSEKHPNYNNLINSASIAANNLNLTVERSPRYKTPGYAKTPAIDVDPWADEDYGGCGVIYWKDNYDGGSMEDNYDSSSPTSLASAVISCKLGSENTMESSPDMGVQIAKQSSQSPSRSTFESIPLNPYTVTSDPLSSNGTKSDAAFSTINGGAAIINDNAGVPKRRFLSKNKGINILDFVSNTPLKSETFKTTNLSNDNGCNSSSAEVNLACPSKSDGSSISSMDVSGSTPPSQSTNYMDCNDSGSSTTTNTTTSFKRSVKLSKSEGEVTSNSKKKVFCKINKPDCTNEKEDEMVSTGLVNYAPEISYFSSFTTYNSNSIASYDSSIGRSISMSDLGTDNESQVVDIVADECTSEDPMLLSKSTSLYESKSRKPSRRRVSVGGNLKAGAAAKTEFEINDVAESMSNKLNTGNKINSSEAGQNASNDVLDIYESKSSRLTARRRSVGGKGRNVALDDINLDDSELVSMGIMKDCDEDSTWPGISGGLKAQQPTKRTFFKRSAAPPSVALAGASIKSYFAPAPSVNAPEFAPSSAVSSYFPTRSMFFDDALAAKRKEQERIDNAVSNIDLYTSLSVSAIASQYYNLKANLFSHINRFITIIKAKSGSAYPMKYLESFGFEDIQTKVQLDSSNLIILSMISSIKDVLKSISTWISQKTVSISDDDIMAYFAPLFLLISANYRDFDSAILPEAASELNSVSIVDNRSPKTRVKFVDAVDQSSCVFTPNDRQPFTWKFSYTEALRWREIAYISEFIHQEFSSKGIQVVNLLDKIKEHFAGNKSVMDMFLASNGDSFTINEANFSYQELAIALQGARNIFADLKSQPADAVGSNSIEFPRPLPQLSISWRISWHCTSVLRAQLRWLLDPPPHFISSASITGQQSVYETYRSHFYETIQCTAIRKNVYTDFIVDNSNAWQDEKNADAECYKPTETAELTLSYLISEALRQIHVFLNMNTKIHFEQMRELSTDDIDDSCVSLLNQTAPSSKEEDKVYIAQLIIAAELSRKFLNNLLSLSSFKQLTIDFEDKFAKISEVCAIIHSTGCVDDLHWTLLRLGVDGLRGVTSRPFISQNTIRGCKSTIKEYKTRVYKRYSTDIGFGIDEFIFDFPRLELI